MKGPQSRGRILSYGRITMDFVYKKQKFLGFFDTMVKFKVNIILIFHSISQNYAGVKSTRLAVKKTFHLGLITRGSILNGSKTTGKETANNSKL